MRKDKAFVCFCVDGQSDVDALNMQFKEGFDVIGGNYINVDFRFAEFQGDNHGDITSLINIEPENVQNKIYKYYFKQQDRKSDLGWEDLTHIIHIIDIDGAYVKDEDIHGFSNEEEKLAGERGDRGKAKKVLYLDDHIAVSNEIFPNKESPIELLCQRNKRKRRVIEFLRSLEVLKVGKKEVKYEIYYFSSNIDHFLYGDANLSGPQKMRNASDFSRFNWKWSSFCDFFMNSKYITRCDYDSSWEALRKGNASITRGSNLNLLIEKIKNSTLEDWL